MTQASTTTVGDRLDTMTRDERSQLLYLETRAVDYGGKVATEKMNGDDFKITDRWRKKGFIRFERLLAKHVGRVGGRCTHCVVLTDEAWECAALERRRRADRNLSAAVRESLDHFEKQKAS